VADCSAGLGGSGEEQRSQPQRLALPSTPTKILPTCCRASLMSDKSAGSPQRCHRSHTCGTRRGTMQSTKRVASDHRQAASFCYGDVTSDTPTSSEFEGHPTSCSRLTKARNSHCGLADQPARKATRVARNN